ncbi:hypothetical protein B0H14DRAFT_2659449 [Mycena olivaceomarginata]|nr:hypothetical protein B0H14DRAFT_2659449 [Mycena olivaceomarginata]
MSSPTPLKKFAYGNFELVNATGAAAPGDSGGNGAAVASSGGAAAPQAVALLLPQTWWGGVGAAPGAASGGVGCTARVVVGLALLQAAVGWCCSTRGAGAVPGSAAAAGSGVEVPLADAIEPTTVIVNWVDDGRFGWPCQRVRGPNMKATERKRLREIGDGGRRACGDPWDAYQEVKRRMNFSSAFKQRRKPVHIIFLLVQYRATAKYMAEEIEDKREELERRSCCGRWAFVQAQSCCTGHQVGVLENLTREVWVFGSLEPVAWLIEVSRSPTSLERANMVGFAMFVRGDLHDQGNSHVDRVPWCPQFLP